ncbi:MAG: radical SAM protein [Spirochaetes bacterium]|nr:radical SAM protein [Spirochaetota bacterium]
MNYSLETGPIRPPSEAESLLLRLTRNCTWNKCAFCHIYKGKPFSRRTVEEIKTEIDTIKHISDDLKKISDELGRKGTIDRNVVMNAIDKNISLQDEYYRIGSWLSSGANTVFLQDANSLAMKTGDVIAVLKYLKEKFPSINRITTYARSKTISKKTLEELKDLRSAGLTRLHVGMESGSDKVLKMMDKGVSSEEHIAGGEKAMAAGFDLSVYFMPGLGGKELSEEHAMESARVINAINPTFIRIRTTVPVPDTTLYMMMSEKKWTPMSDEEKVRELRLLIENFDGITSTFLSDHILNLLEDLGGDLPHGKKDMLMLIDQFLNMDKGDKENFIIGRRLGHFRYLSDYKRDKNITDVKKQVLQNYSSIDEAVMQISLNFI